MVRILLAVAVLLIAGLTAYAARPTGRGGGLANGRGGGTAINPDRAVVVDGVSQFALDLYGKVAAKDGNVFFSPYSISCALGMTYGGAKGPTAQQMAGVLHVNLDADRYHGMMGLLKADLDNAATLAGNNKPPFQLYVANALWGQNGFPFRAEFQTLVKNDYAAQLNNVDFVKAAEAARQQINQWVATTTKDKIKDLIGQGVLGPDTRLVLTNAIYFKSDWMEQFKAANTRSEPFTLAPGKTAQTPLMHQTHSFGYFDNNDLQAVSLPYAGNALSMVLLVPKKADGVAAVEKGLNADGLRTILTGLCNRPIDLTMPKFKTTCSFSLTGTLKDLGMKLPFTDAADFSGMTTTDKLLISDVIHKAFVAVDENGTEAAAATAVVMSLAMAAGPGQPPVVVKADHPFVYLIRHNDTGLVLFMGRVADPTAK